MTYVRRSPGPGPILPLMRARRGLPHGRRLRGMPGSHDQVVAAWQAVDDVAPDGLGEVLVTRRRPQDDAPRLPERSGSDLDGEQGLPAQPPVDRAPDIGAQEIG